LPTGKNRGSAATSRMNLELLGRHFTRNYPQDLTEAVRSSVEADADIPNLKLL
jgi:hypothetical protein